MRTDHDYSCVSNERQNKRGLSPILLTEAYKVPFRFTGKIDKVTIDLKQMKAADKAEKDTCRPITATRKRWRTK